MASEKWTFKDNTGNKYCVDLMSNHRDLINDVISMIVDSFTKENTNDPQLYWIAYGSGKVEDRIEFSRQFRLYIKLWIEKLIKFNSLHLSLIAFEMKTKKLVTIALNNDFFNQNMSLTENDLKPYMKQLSINTKVENFIYKTTNNGIKNALESLNEKACKNTFFRVSYRAIDSKYSGRGIVKSMYPLLLKFAKECGYKYVVHETTNPITQHICSKYGNARTFYQCKYSDYFEMNETWVKLGKIDPDQSCMFQLVCL